MADLVERLRSHADTQIEDDLAYIQSADALMREASDRIAALEAEASKGERRGLERAAEVAEAHGRKRAPGADSNSTCILVPVYGPELARQIRALIPEAPVREGE